MASTPFEGLLIRYFHQGKERDVTSTSGAVIEPIYHHKLRYRLTYMPGRYIFRTTIDYNHFRQQDGKGYRFDRRQGYQCTQLCSYTFPFPLSVSVQGTWFHTEFMVIDRFDNCTACTRHVSFFLFVPIIKIHRKALSRSISNLKHGIHSLRGFTYTVFPPRKRKRRDEYKRCSYRTYLSP